MKASGLVPVTLLASFLAACGEPEGPPAQGAVVGEPTPDSGNFVESVYERSFVFASLEGDSVFIVPWLMTATQMPDSVVRDAQGWIARGGVWDRFYAERWRTPPTRAPNRILPHGELGLLVGDEGSIDGIVFEDPPRSLEIILGQAGDAWTGARGGTFQVLNGSAYLGDQRIDGMVLDVARASAGDVATGGDWAFLLSGDSAHFVLAADSEHGGEAAPVYRGWGSHRAVDFQWPEVTLAWARTEAFPPARRDIPVEWTIETESGSLSGTLEAVSAEILPGEGPGPLLPVLALYEVAGELTTASSDFPVHGVVVHRRR
ncbi:MAG: hypothetical protein R3253_01295 [Longimicrobiales bacterium]|nr:hypothetical protein [Longimicrobiales bacterium]